MNKKALVISISAAVLIVLASLSSVIGTNIVKSDAERSIASPLFAVRTQRSLDKEEAKKISANYLGKGKQLNILLPKKSMAQVWIDKAIKIFDTNPVLIDKLDGHDFIAPQWYNHYHFASTMIFFGKTDKLYKSYSTIPLVGSTHLVRR